MDPFLLEGPRVDPLTLTFEVKVIPRSSGPNCCKIIANKLQMSLANGRVSLNKMVHFQKADPKTRKCLPNIHFSLELDQIWSKYSPRRLLQDFQNFWSVSDNKGSSLRLMID